MHSYTYVQWAPELLLKYYWIIVSWRPRHLNAWLIHSVFMQPHDERNLQSFCSKFCCGPTVGHAPSSNFQHEAVCWKQSHSNQSQSGASAAFVSVGTKPYQDLTLGLSYCYNLVGNVPEPVHAWQIILYFRVLTFLCFSFSIVRSLVLPRSSPSGSRFHGSTHISPVLVLNPPSSTALRPSVHGHPTDSFPTPVSSIPPGPTASYVASVCYSNSLQLPTYHILY